MAKKKSTKYKGKVRKEFSTIGGDGKKPIKKVFKVGSWYYTESKDSLEYLKLKNYLE